MGVESWSYRNVTLFFGSTGYVACVTNVGILDYLFNVTLTFQRLRNQEYILLYYITHIAYYIYYILYYIIIYYIYHIYIHICIYIYIYYIYIYIYIYT